MMFSATKIFLAPALLPSWLANVKANFVAHVQHKQPRTAPTAGVMRSQFHVQTAQPFDRADVTYVQVTGTLDRFTYEGLIKVAADLYTQGSRCLLLDLRQTTGIELSGLFALVSIARLYSGATLLDPEGGWAALRSAATESTPALGQRVKLLASASVTAMIRNASFCDFFEIYATSEAASAAFPSELAG